MQVTIELPDDLAARLQPVWSNLPRKVLEVVVVEAYREQLITRYQVGQFLGLTSRFEVDGFLKAANAPLHYDEADFDQDLQIMQDLVSQSKVLIH
jgi:predicted HTH domain antitoxin